jgi:hypothetical protein
MLVKSAFGYTVMLILLTTVIFIFIDDFTYKLNPLLNEIRNEKNNYNLPKALGIASVITLLFILLKEKVLNVNTINNTTKNNTKLKNKRINNLNNINRILKSIK